MVREIEFCYYLCLFVFDELHFPYRSMLSGVWFVKAGHGSENAGMTLLRVSAMLLIPQDFNFHA